MTDYVKIIDGLPQFPPKNKGSILNYDLDIDLLIQDGYKPFVPAEIPETIRMYHFEYVETDVITETIVYDETEEEAEAREEQDKQDRINKLTMTALDFIGVLKTFGLTSQQIKEYLEEHIELDEQLKYCQNVWCGVVKQICPLEVDGVEITVAMVEQAFKTKHGIVDEV